MWVIKRKEERTNVHFQGKKILEGMLIFIVADIWNSYNMGMKKATN
jgi:hypothetical protein